MTRYERARDQRSTLWRKRRAQAKAQRRNEPRMKHATNAGYTPHKEPLMTRIMRGVAEAMAAKRDYQQAQSR
jgi:hypothetical protein